MAPEAKYWFRAKRYGWGWGLPLTWQGWVVLALFGVLLVVGNVLLPPATHAVSFVIFIAVLSAALIGVCYLKGEPPKWHWGER